MNYAQTYLMVNIQSFPAQSILLIQKELEELDAQKMDALLMTDIKNPTTALILSIFAGHFGIDRFYIGNKELGIAKLSLTIFGFLTVFFIIGIFFLIAVGIWSLIDWFLIMDACKKANLERFMQQVHQLKSMSRTSDTYSFQEERTSSFAVESSEYK